MKPSHFIRLLATLTLWSVAVQPVAAHSGRLFSAYYGLAVPPAIPGDYVAHAASGALLLPDRIGKVYVMNDSANLYVLLAIPDTGIDPSDGWALFDNDHDGIVMVGDDGWRIKLSGGVLDWTDQFRTAGPPYEAIEFGMLDIFDGGTNDGRGKISVISGVAYFELVHPLASGDPAHDILALCDPQFRRILGVDFGVRLGLFLEKGGFMHDIKDPGKWDDVRIACAGDQPVNPIRNYLMELQANIGKLPDFLLKNAPEERRAALLFKTEVLSKMIESELPAVQLPAVQLPAVQLPAVQLPAVQKLANDIIPKLDPADKSCWLCGVSPDPYVVELHRIAVDLLIELKAALGVSPEPGIGGGMQEGRP